MHATDKVVCLLFLFKLHVFALLWTHSPQAHLFGVILTENSLDTIHHVGNIETRGVPAAENICVLDGIQEHL
ncbi:hypothetical protein D3C86_1362320 [compost metagenome]